MGAIGILDSAIHTLAAMMQGLVMAGVIPPPPPLTSAPYGRVVAFSLPHLRFTFGVAGYADLPPTWEEVAR